MRVYAQSAAALCGLVLLCAACGSATYEPPRVIYLTAPSGSGVVLPEEAQRIIDAYTATARVMATQAQFATATEESARATSTTAARLTADALMVKQTESALALTAGAGQAEATNAAAVHTAQALQTAAASTPTAAALLVAVAATGTQLARVAETTVRRQALDDQIAAARGWGVLGLLLLFLLGAGAALVFGLSDLISARAELQRAAAARAQAEAMQLWIMQYGGHLLQLRSGQWEEMPPAQLAAPAAPAGPELESNIREVPIRTKSEITGTVPVGREETPERLKVLHLLTQALFVAGPGARSIPSAPVLGMHPQEWQDAVNLLKAGPDRVGYITTSPGRPKAGDLSRTRLVQPAYKTIGQLLDGVKRGDVLPLPPPPPPTPSAGNIQNVTSE